jgi:uncharacterized protein YjlB
VTVVLGGPNGHPVTLRAGDVVVIPAGVAHRNLRQTDNLLVIGAYPGGAAYNTRRGNPAELEEVTRAVGRVGVPGFDPVAGEDARLRQLWTVP